MQDFYFEAADALGRKISGTIKASSEGEARQKLKGRDLAVLLVRLKTDGEGDISQEKRKDLKKYEFEAKDKDGKISHGVIDAVDEGTAYKSLKVEYDFDVTYLVDASLPEKEKKKIKAQGIDQELKQWFETELKYSDYYKKKKAEQEKKRKRKDAIKLTPSQEKELLLIQQRIAEVVASVSGLLEENKQYLDKNKKREIEDRLNLLSRLRQSNAIDHLRSLTEKIMVQLGDDSIFLEHDIDKNSTENDDLMVTKRKFQEFAKEFDKKIEKEIANLSITIDLEAIDPTILTRKIAKIHPLERLGRVLYYTFSFVFVFLVAFWVFASFQNVFSSNQEIIARTFFYFDSIRLWGMTLFSGGITFGFLPIMFFVKNKSLTKKQKWQYFGAMMFLMFLLLFHIHSLFGWAS